MPPIINAQELSKRFGPDPLFDDISFTVSEGDRDAVGFDGEVRPLEVVGPVLDQDRAVGMGIGIGAVDGRLEGVDGVDDDGGV